MFFLIITNNFIMCIHREKWILPNRSIDMEKSKKYNERKQCSPLQLFLKSDICFLKQMYLTGSHNFKTLLMVDGQNIKLDAFFSLSVSIYCEHRWTKELYSYINVKIIYFFYFTVLVHLYCVAAIFKYRSKWARPINSQCLRVRCFRFYLTPPPPPT